MSDLTLPLLWLLGFGAAAVIYFGIVIACDIARYRRMARMAVETSRNFLGVEICAQARTEKDRIAARTPHVRIDDDDAATDKHTGAGASDGDRERGPGVTVLNSERALDNARIGGDNVHTWLAASMPRQSREPRRCARCHHFHLDADSLICGACRDAMIAGKGAA